MAETQARPSTSTRRSTWWRARRRDQAWPPRRTSRYTTRSDGIVGVVMSGPPSFHVVADDGHANGGQLISDHGAIAMDQRLEVLPGRQEQRARALLRIAGPRHRHLDHVEDAPGVAAHHQDAIGQEHRLVQI